MDNDLQPEARGAEAERPKTLNEEVLWEDLEYDHIEKTSDWYWLLGTIAALLFIIALFLKDFLLAVIILLGSFILGTHAGRTPKTITYGLLKDGVKFGDHLFRYDSIKSFWVNPEGRLVIESSRYLKPHIYIPLQNTDSERVRTLILAVVKEQKFEGTLSDRVADFFGF